MSQKWKREMVSMKSREVSKTNRAIGSDDLLSVDAKASNDWIEGGAGTNISGLGEHVLSIISGLTEDKLPPDVATNNNCWRIAA